MADPTLADLYAYGLPLAAMGSVTVAQQQAQLNAALAERDAAFRARYGATFVVNDLRATQAVCEIAAFGILKVRGYNPQSGADRVILDSCVMARKWIGEVERQQQHPNVIVAAPSVNLAAPNVVSKPRRGWNC